MNTIFFYDINKQIVFNFIFLSLIIIIKSFISFKSFSLSNENILLFTEEGIYKYNLDSKSKYLIKSFDFILDSYIIEFTEINKLSNDEGGYIFCKLHKYIYIISNDGDALIETITLNDDSSDFSKVSIAPYKLDNIYYCILVYINSQNNIKIIKYKININSPVDNELIIDKINEDNNFGYLDGISCHLIYSSLYQKNILICFATNKNDYLINAIIFDPEDMSILSLKYKNIEINIDSQRSSSFIRSIISYNKEIFFICQDQSAFPLRCQLYDFENNIWSDYINLGSSFLGIQSDFNLYLTDNNEYIVFFNYKYNQYNIHNYDKNFKGKCSYKYQFNKCGNEYSYNNLLYNKDKLYLLINCYENENSNNTNFSSYEIEEICNDQEDIYDFNITLSSTLFNSLLSSSDLKEQSSYPYSYLFSSILNSSKNSILSSTALIPSTQIFNLPNSTSNKLDINCTQDICFGKTNKTKEEILNNLEEIMENINIGIKYLIYGEEYNISISPINELKTYQSSYVNFTLCENILRIKNNLTNNETLTILKIEIDKMNDKALTNQIEYAIYNEQKEMLELSDCENINVIIHYNIKDNSNLNASMIIYYSDLGIDIFNINDSFFNDICYPYSNSYSDIILKDRISDIYQNYSLCDNNCEYDFIDFDSNSVICKCKVKIKINTYLSPPIFPTIVKDIFKDSNIGILKCLHLIFNFKHLLYNIGFWIFLIFVICHIPLYIHYFIKGITSILVYCEYNIRYRNDLNMIHNSLTNKTNNLLNNKKNKKKNEKNKLKNSLCSSKNSRSNIKNKSTASRKINDIRNSTKIKELNKNKNIIKNLVNPNKKKEKINFGKKNGIKDLSLKKDSKYSNSSVSIFKIRKKDDFINKKIKEEHNYINDLNYYLGIYTFENAILYDKRKFWLIYYICLLSQERFLNSFILKSPLEIKSLRISLFIFNYSCDFALNSIFYSNQKISDKYHYNGSELRLFILINNITICLFSSIISVIIIKFLNIFTHSKKEINSIINEIKNNNSNQKELKYKINNYKFNYKRLYKICNILKFKIICYIVFEFSILLLFFYYVTGFCIVYQKTQIDWLYDSLISILLSILFKLLLAFFVSILYIISLKSKSKLLFKIALFLY